MRMYVCTHTHTCTYIYLYVFMKKQKQHAKPTCMHEPRYACMYVCMYVNMYTCLHVYISRSDGLTLLCRRLAAPSDPHPACTARWLLAHAAAILQAMRATAVKPNINTASVIASALFRTAPRQDAVGGYSRGISGVYGLAREGGRDSRRRVPAMFDQQQRVLGGNRVYEAAQIVRAMKALWVRTDYSTVRQCCC